MVDLVSGRVQTNRSTKITVFGCSDAHGAVVYNGIGIDDNGLTPSDWLLALGGKGNLFHRGLFELLDLVKNDLQARLQIIRAKYGPKKARHTFVFGAWHKGASAIYGISNYERVDDDKEAVEGSDEVTLSSFLPTPTARLRIVTTGLRPRLTDVRAIAEALKTGPPNRTLASSVRAVRNVAYGRGKATGTVGASCQWAWLGPERSQVWFGLDVAGGAIAQETPNLINIGAEVHLGGSFSARIGGPGMLIGDTYMGDDRARGVARYDAAKKKFVFSELRCGICGAPWPASHRFCEVCLYEKHRGKGRAQRRIV